MEVEHSRVLTWIFFGAQPAARRMSSSVPAVTFLNSASVPAVVVSSAPRIAVDAQSTQMQATSSIMPRITPPNEVAVRAVDLPSSTEARPVINQGPVFKFIPAPLHPLTNEEASKVLEDTLNQYGPRTYSQEHPQFAETLIQFTEGTELGYAQMRFVNQLAKTIYSGCEILFKGLTRTFFPSAGDDRMAPSTIEMIAALDVVDGYCRAAVAYLKHAMSTDANFCITSLNVNGATFYKKLTRQMFIRLKEIGADPAKLKLPRLPTRAVNLVNSHLCTSGSRTKLRHMHTVSRDLFYGSGSLGAFKTAEELALVRKIVPVATTGALVNDETQKLACDSPQYKEALNQFINRSTWRIVDNNPLIESRTYQGVAKKTKQAKTPNSSSVSSSSSIAVSSVIESKVNKALLAYASNPIPIISATPLNSYSSTIASSASAYSSSASVAMASESDPFIPASDFNVLQDASDTMMPFVEQASNILNFMAEQQDDASIPESNSSAWIGMDESFLDKLNEEEQLALAVANSDMQALERKLQEESESMLMHSPLKRTQVEAFNNPQDPTCCAFDEDAEVMELTKKLPRSSEEETDSGSKEQSQ